MFYFGDVGAVLVNRRAVLRQGIRMLCPITLAADGILMLLGLPLLAVFVMSGGVHY